MIFAFVESPLQALNVVEYLNRNGDNSEECRFIIFSNSLLSDINLKQIEFVLNEFNYKDRVVVDVNSGLKDLIKKRKKLKTLSKILSQNSCQQCIIGEYRSLSSVAFVNKINPDKVVVVDDGNASLRIDRQSSKYSIIGTVKEIIALFFNLKIKRLNKVEFFSVYDIESSLSKEDSYIKNNYNFISSRLSCYPKSEKEFIIGSPLQSARVVDNDLPLSLNLIDRVIEVSGSSKDNLVYISHRREQKNKLEAIEKYGVRVLSLSYPFEIYAMVNKEHASKIHGFYSSLFINMLNFNENVNITSYEIDLKDVNSSYREFVSKVYKSYNDVNDSRFKLIRLSNE
ncbi:hypothetical protein AMR76_21800 [Vibrio furnissii]|uniref:CMP-N-acetylneuraminate-beta-galactosamide-alpha-2, 3-sialyltransferase n=1 Tax=Vibrio furnissii TaxID=29494 RepID=A0A0Q2RHY5_VIBFU|nr:hypothetical protein [Vibrio furnissii]KQH83646.1 hypothetical protein AMR76_21800 [Vibrio furnissii]